MAKTILALNMPTRNADQGTNTGLTDQRSFYPMVVLCSAGVAKLRRFELSEKLYICFFISIAKWSCGS